MSSHVNALTLGVFAAILVLSLAITYWAAKRTHTAADFWAAGQRITASQNGLALAGDYMSTSAFLGLTGLLFLYGFDGILIDLASVVAFVPMLMLVAEQLRNVGRYTLGDVLAFRMREHPARTAAALSTVTVSIIYLVALMVSGGVLFGAVTGLSFRLSLVGAGLVILLYVVAGGMLAITWVQIIKASLLMVATLVVVVLVLEQIDFNLLGLLNEAAQRHPAGEDYLGPGILFTDPVNGLSTILAFSVGVIGLPHLLIRSYTVRDGNVARASLGWGIGIIGTFFVVIVIVGYGARVILGTSGDEAVGPGGNQTLLVLARELGGDFLFASIAAVAFTAILAVVAGLLVAASGAFVNDFLFRVVKKAGPSERHQVRAARLVALVTGVVSIVLALAAGPGFNVSILVALAFSVAASANTPALLMALYWKRFTTIGMVTGIVTGLVCSLILIILSPLVWPGSDAPVNLTNPAIVSIPLSALGCWLGTVLGGREPRSEGRFYEMAVRAHVGAPDAGGSSDRVGEGRER